MGICRALVDHRVAQLRLQGRQLYTGRAYLYSIGDNGENLMKNAAKEKTRMILQTMITLASAALGLVAALAWNEAIKAFIKEILGEGEGLAALFLYAIMATVIAIAVLLILANAAARIGGEAAIEREAEG